VSPTEGVIREAWEMYKSHWRHLLTISFVVYLAIALVSLVLAVILTDWLAGLLATAISLVALFWVQGALVKAVEDVRDGRPDLTLGETFQRVRPQLGSIIVAGILAGLGIVLGLILLIVPGLILLTWWVLIIPVIVLEQRSAGDSFSRSRELVRGYGWGVFGVIVLTILLLIGFGIVLGIVLSPFEDWLRSFLSNVISGTLTAPFIAVTWTILYYRLRAAKEPAEQAVPAPPAT
jgi:tetrahydromethanopterin S-methyltransferase subunit G